ncbi:MAG TPA: carboxypeptidase M32 [Bacillus sp. (in: firmicutes)]|uniref:carboxypeptidase M32 n=1 Tax=Bacillus litorisediminis TaxID=2922713 RepID=UPI001FAFF73E|nr:carboxypeptidase M32 [Bacillus litorisediminis]HWO76345.1 carboxypeptidase M32 [Bacillus sp. (in: firmicutes)]
MAEKWKEVENAFRRYIKQITAYNEAISLIYWDMRTGAPKKGIEQRSEVVGMLSSTVYDLLTSDTMAAYIAELLSPDAQNHLSPITLQALSECKKEYELNKKIPKDEYEEYVILQSKSEHIWEEAKAKADFSLFQPYLEKLVETTKRFINYWGYEGHPYNRLLDFYEPGMTVDVLDRVFGQLRQDLIKLVKEVQSSATKPDPSILFFPFPKDKQKSFSLEILKGLGYDLDAGRLDETVHPFATGINRGDVRITTNYNEKDFRTAVFGTIHECGHALYEQNISAELDWTPLASGTSMGIHESQSLFFENFIGRQFGFWKKNFALLQDYADGHLDHVSLADFYRAINESKPSLIRIEADELTYPLHIMVRYEIEKGLFSGDIQVKDLPEIWNTKYEEYLGVVPRHDGEGVLQDVHWSGGSFGYFPSYALGYMYAAQFKHAMLKDLPHFNELLEAGNILPIREWLTEKIHKHGKMKKPLEILLDVTSEELNAKYLVDYLRNKFSGVYQLS